MKREKRWNQTKRQCKSHPAALELKQLIQEFWFHDQQQCTYELCCSPYERHKLVIIKTPDTTGACRFLAICLLDFPVVHQLIN